MKMKTVVLLLMVLFVIAAACKKDRYTSEPQLKFKSVSPDNVIKGNIIDFISSFTDDEGDIQDSVILVYKRYNGSGGILTLDTIRLMMDPDGIPEARLGDMDIKFGYGEFIPNTFFLNLEPVDRQVSFGLIIRDKKGQRSNYVESNKITLKKL